MVQLADVDWPIRLAAFGAVAALVRAHGPVLPWREIEHGFAFGNRRFLFANQTKGIFRPAGMSDAALSIKSTIPKRGVGRYQDLASNEGFTYALQARGAEYHDNRLLLRAMELATPLIYFFGVEPGAYRPIFPAFVVAHNIAQATVTIVADDPSELYEPGTYVSDAVMKRAVRRYSTVEVKKRLHQELFRHAVLRAYSERCAVCRLPRRELLDAAHIEPDRDVRGEPTVSNGLAMCKLHHAAFDANLLGVRPDHVIEISGALLTASDGPTLEHALKGFAGSKLSLPRRHVDWPAPDHLEARYAAFRKTGS